MDYQRASYTRQKSLLSLIGEKKFEDGKGIGASIGGAISDKFKASAMRFKEKIDPLNMTRNVFGKGTLGDIAVTGLGRLTGRKDRDIGYFGGFQRKQKEMGGGSSDNGPSKSSNDSTSEILGKMYAFMVKSDETDTKNSQIEKSFRTEEFDEEKRRHDQLVKAIKDYTKKHKKAVPEEDKKEDDGKGFWAGLLDNIKKWIDNLMLQFAPLLDFAKMLGTNLIKTLLSFGTFLITPAGALFLAAIAAGTVGAWMIKQIKEDPQAALAGKGGIGMAVAGLGSEGQLPEWNEEQANKAQLVKSKAVDKKGIKNATIEELEAKKQLLVEYGYEGARVSVKKGSTDKSEISKAKQLDDLDSEIALRKSSPTATPAAASPASPSSPTATPAAASPASPSSPTATPAAASVPAVTAPMQATAPVSVPPPQVMTKAANPSIPTQMSAEQSLSAGETVVPIVNNSVTTIGGQPPKVIQTSTARPRNNDLNRYLSNIAVPV